MLQQNESFSILLNTTEEVKVFFLFGWLFFSSLLSFIKTILEKKHKDKENMRQDYSVTVTVVGGD